MSHYVRRVKETGEAAWVGPIRSFNQATREAASWRECGQPAEVLESTPELARTVRAWQRAADIRHGRR